MINYVALIIMTMLGSLGALFLKKASGAGSIKKLLGDIYFYLGGGIYFTSALLNIYLLKHMEYSVVLPLTSVTYIWTMTLSYFVLKEKISLKKLLGVGAILVGALLITL